MKHLLKLACLMLLGLPVFGQLATYVNVGGPLYVDSDAITWAADTGCASASTWARAVAIAGTNDPTLYQTGRTDPSSIGCTYTVTNLTYYYVTLKFAETDPNVTRPGQRLINIFINGVAYARGFDTVLNCGALASVCDRSFGPIAVSNSVVNILVTQQQGQPTLQALAIVTASPFTVSAPGGPNCAIQYNNAALFGGVATLCYNAALNQINHQATTAQSVSAAPFHIWRDISGNQISQIDAVGGFDTFASSIQKTALFRNLFVLSSDSLIQWANNVAVGLGAIDLGLYRNGAGVLEINNGTPGTYRDFLLRNIALNGQAGNGVKCIHTDNAGNLTVAAADCSAGGGGSVFTGSTAAAPAFSATPTFSLADISVKSPILFQPGAMTANVTAVTFTNKTAGAEFYLAWLQDGTGGRTVTYGASVAGSPACQVDIDPTANSTTIQHFIVGSDGSTVNGVGCVSSSLNPPQLEQSVAGIPTPPLGYYVCGADSTDHTGPECKANNSANIFKMVKSGVDINTVTGQVTVTHLAAALPVNQGGTGVLLAQGNGNKVQLSTGSPASGNCAQFDANGNTVDAGAACNGSSSTPFDNTTLSLKDPFCWDVPSANGFGLFLWHEVTGSPTHSTASDGTHFCGLTETLPVTTGQTILVPGNGADAGPYLNVVGGTQTNWDIRFTVRLSRITNTTHYSCLVGPGVGGIPASKSICIRFDVIGFSDTVWTAIICTDGGSCTTSTTNMPAPVAGTSAVLRIFSTVAGTIQFSVNGSTATSLSSTNAVNMSPQISGSNNAGTTMTQKFYMVAFLATGIVL